jgi:hypothetical protein
MKYYIIDYGKDTVDIAEAIVNSLRSKGHHVVIYITNLSESVYCQEVSEDEFLNHFAPINKNEQN